MDECRNDPAEQAPLTLGQERLWFLDRLDPGDPAYNIYLANRLRGALDIEALQRAYDGVTARHAPLRTRYRTVDGVPVQQAMPPRPQAIELLDLRGATEERVREALNERAVAPFDLETGSVVRACLARVGARVRQDEHILLVVLHHIAGDGWSLDVLQRELACLYNGETLPPLEADYLEFARVRRALSDNEEALAYWCERLADPPVLELPTDRPRPAVKTSNGDVVVREFSLETANAVRDACRGLRCTPFMLLLTIFELVLAERSGQDDLCVGTPIAGRDELELEGLIGYFSGVLVLRAEVPGHRTLRELVLGTKENFLKALAHQDIPFERLTAALDLPRDLSRSPLFQATFTYHSQVSGGQAGFAGLEAEPYDAGAQHVKVDLSTEVMNDAGGAFHLTFSYNTDLFERGSIEALSERFGLLLQEFLKDSGVRAADLPLVDPQMARQLEEWGTGAALDHVRPVLETVASRQSNAALLERADEIAQRLRQVGVKPGNLVALELERGAEVVPAMLAVWRVGAGYVPIDPDQPEARRVRMLADAGVAAVVKGDAVVGVAGGKCFDDPAYAIFTSGSSGVPKPVLVGQEALAARVAWMVPAYELRPGDRVVQFAALGFDTHAEEIWPALCAGATVVTLPDGPQSLPEVLASDPDITVLDLPTAYWRSLLEMVDDIAWPPALRLVILGGEQVDQVAIAVWRQHFGDTVRLVNTYGPTEATIIATSADLDAASTVGRPPIGRPIGGVRLKVLDPQGRLVPPGVAGELWIGGLGVARGYVGRDELTAERFVDGYYRTGDLVRWRSAEPVLEFLGRLDKQIKMRGIRVEPGEVEVALLAMDGVRQAAVVAHDDSLAAYVVGSVGEEEVRAFAATVLPGFLVPSSVMVMPRLPLTRNGKLDLRALPVPVRASHSDGFVAPRTDAEVLVASVWSQVLGVETIGADDNFFDLGGHSLMATRVIARIRSSVELDLPIRALFTHPTVAALATAVEDALIAEIDRLTEDEAVALAGGMS